MFDHGITCPYCFVLLRQVNLRVLRCARSEEPSLECPVPRNHTYYAELAVAVPVLYFVAFEGFRECERTATPQYQRVRTIRPLCVV